MSFGGRTPEIYLSRTLQQVSIDYQVVSASRYNFIQHTAKPMEPWYNHFIFREIHSTNIIGNPLPPKICHRGIDNIIVAQGNHCILWPDQLEVFPHLPIETHLFVVDHPVLD